MVGRLHSSEVSKLEALPTRRSLLSLCGTLAATRLSQPRDTEVERGRAGTGPLTIGKRLFAKLRPSFTRHWLLSLSATQNPTFLRGQRGEVSKMPAAPKKIAIWIMYGSGRRLLQSGLSRATGTVNVHPLVFSKVCHVDGKKGSLYRYLYRLRGPMLVMRLAIAKGKWHFLRLGDKGRFVLLPLVVFFYPAFSRRCCRSHKHPSISFCTDLRTFYLTFADVDSRHSDDSCNSDIHNRAADALRFGDMYVVLMGLVMSASDHTLHGSYYTHALQHIPSSPFAASSLRVLLMMPTEHMKLELTIHWLELFSFGCTTIP
nr:hypothetical protein 15E6.50 [imported] - Neurospora crassa [Neurospora crassa]